MKEVKMLYRFFFIIGTKCYITDSATDETENNLLVLFHCAIQF